MRQRGYTPSPCHSLITFISCVAIKKSGLGSCHAPLLPPLAIASPDSLSTYATAPQAKLATGSNSSRSRIPRSQQQQQQQRRVAPMWRLPTLHAPN